MNSLGGLTAFFYNVIPGVIFLLMLDSLKMNWFNLQSLPGDDGQQIFWVIILGLFIGFFGQGVMKLLKGGVINEYIFKNIQTHKQNSAIYKEAVKKLSINGIDLKDDFTKDVFYAMDNYLRNSSSCHVINHYSERAAFWANISLGLFVIIFILLYEHGPIESLIFILLLMITIKFLLNSIQSQYESVLQTFVQTVKDDTKNTKAKK
ncbi:hypothetical protein HYW55_05335 [Candidatus Gottesmanbacteria bacterium]|nr:hypothetical protein [Candidatus Gottesmanbacteria bacterium]